MASSDCPTLQSMASEKGVAKDECIQFKLERLSCAFANIVNTHDFDLALPASQELNHHLSPEWLSSMDTQPAKLSWPQQLEQWRARAAEMPSVRFTVHEVSSDVDERKGHAIVCLNMEVVGMSESVTLHAMNEVRWKRVGVGQNARWLCFYTLGLRGTPGNSGGLG
ncbi:hypothetical protein AC579_521 [Pseudocercospora musae]|uniref:SnoaL-like domain-containing protein n=1 Tax=Pseudocercospora musae TaxID=113226 RepID=A0A139IR81_9PEZI|nr:hypothetical protein AC579_521 [Pseudocercospora musae]